MKFSNPFRARANAFTPGTGKFPSIDTEVLDARLKTERRGAKDGADNIPPADARSYGIVEIEIIEAVGELRKKGIEYCESQMAAYASRIRAARAEREQIRLRSGELKNVILVEADVWRGQLWNEQRRVTETQAKLNAYCEQHRIVGPPRPSKNSILMIGILAVMLIGEIAASGLFFAEKNEMGFLGGIGAAAVISSINVIFGLGCGFGSRYVRLRGFFPKIGGLLAIALFFVAAISINLAVVHFRDALSTVAWADALILSMSSLSADPFVLGSFTSLMLFIIGLVACGVAFIEGALWHDPRPGHTGRYEQAEKAIEHYGNLYREAQEELTRCFDLARDELQGETQKFRARVHSALNAVSEQSSVTRQFESFIESCDLATNKLLTSYRESNQRNRSVDSPVYFEQAHAFTRYAPSTGLHNIELDEAKAEISQIDKIVEEGVKDILNTRKNAVDSFTSVKVLVENANLDRQVPSAAPAAHTPSEPV